MIRDTEGVRGDARVAVNSAKKWGQVMFLDRPAQVAALFLGFSFFLYSAPVAAAKKYDLCICQTGVAEPVHFHDGSSGKGFGVEGEVGFYKAGCLAYLAVTSCEKKIVRPVNQPIEDLLNQIPKGRVNLSYVGHWSNSKDEVKFLKTYVVPAMKSSGCSVDVYNSACRAGNNPYVIDHFLKSLSPVLGPNALTFRGNQAISTGVFDSFLPGKNNFSVKVDSKGVHFPSCEEFQGNGCKLSSREVGEVGVCENRKTGKDDFLICLEMKERRTDPGVGAGSKPGQGAGRGAFAGKTEWRSISDPQVMAELKRYSANRRERATKELEKEVGKEVLARARKDPRVEKYFVQVAGPLGNLEFDSIEQLDEFIRNFKTVAPREWLKERACRQSES